MRKTEAVDMLHLAGLKPIHIHDDKKRRED